MIRPGVGHSLWRTDADGNLVLGEGMTLKEAQAELDRLWAEAEKHPDNSDLDPGEFSGQFLRPSTRWTPPSGRMQVYESRDPVLIAKGKAIGEAARHARMYRQILRDGAEWQALAAEMIAAAPDGASVTPFDVSLELAMRRDARSYG